MNEKIREIQNKYIPFIEEYEWLDSYADDIWKKAEEEYNIKLDIITKKYEDKIKELETEIKNDNDFIGESKW